MTKLHIRRRGTAARTHAMPSRALVLLIDSPNVILTADISGVFDD